MLFTISFGTNGFGICFLNFFLSLSIEKKVKITSNRVSSEELKKRMIKSYKKVI